MKRRRVLFVLLVSMAILSVVLYACAPIASQEDRPEYGPDHFLPSRCWQIEGTYYYVCEFESPSWDSHCVTVVYSTGVAVDCDWG